MLPLASAVGQPVTYVLYSHSGAGSGSYQTYELSWGVCRTIQDGVSLRQGTRRKGTIIVFDLLSTKAQNATTRGIFETKTRPSAPCCPSIPVADPSAIIAPLRIVAILASLTAAATYVLAMLLALVCILPPAHPHALGTQPGLEWHATRPITLPHPTSPVQARHAHCT